MKPHEFIKKSIYDMSIKKGASEAAAKYQSDIGYDQYRKGLYKGKPVDLIKERIIAAGKMK